MTKFTGVIRFLTANQGGRVGGPPSGPRYAATGVRALGDDEERPPGWPWTGGQFSIVVEFGRDGAPHWTTATIRALIPGAPGSEVLEPGAEIVVLEGPREVARFLIDEDQPA